MRKLLTTLAFSITFAANGAVTLAAKLSVGWQQRGAARPSKAPWLLRKLLGSGDAP